MPKNTILVSMDVTSLYTNTPHEEGVTTVCHVYQNFQRNALSYFFILTENFFQLCGSNNLQTHGAAMGTKVAVAFANIFMVRLENRRCNKLVFWKRYFLSIWTLAVLLRVTTICRSEEPLAYQRRIRPEQKKTSNLDKTVDKGLKPNTDVSMLS